MYENACFSQCFCAEGWAYCKLVYLEPRIEFRELPYKSLSCNLCSVNHRKKRNDNDNKILAISYASGVRGWFGDSRLVAESAIHC